MLVFGSRRPCEAFSRRALLTACGILSFFWSGAANPPSFDTVNPDYRVYINSAIVPVVQNICQGSKCAGFGSNNIASYTMDDAWTPITVVVEKITYSAAVDGVGAKIRPSHLHDQGVVSNIDSSTLASTKSISFVVSEPCQLSVELGAETSISATMESYYGFAPLILAINPPESSWPQPKPKLIENPTTGELTCESEDEDRDCIVAEPSHLCTPLQVPADTDLYFPGFRRKSYLWGSGCGAVPKIILLQSNANVFLDSNVVVFARVVAETDWAGIYGYGILSNFYMGGAKNVGAANGIIELKGYATVLGPVLMDSTMKNIIAGRNASIGWTKSFAWETQTDGVTLFGKSSDVYNNFFKVNDDVLKPYQSDTTYRNNTIWHMTSGSAVRLSWGTWRENQAERDGSTMVLNTFVIHDYHCFKTVQRVDGYPRYALQAGLANYGTLISAQHSMSNALGSNTSPILIKGFKVEGKVGALFALTTGYKNLLGLSPWQDSDGCGGQVKVKIEDMDLSRVRSYVADSLVAACNKDFESDNIQNMVCNCKSGMSCFASGVTQQHCRADVWFDSLTDSEVPGVPRLVDTLKVGDRGWVHGLPFLEHV